MTTDSCTVPGSCFLNIFGLVESPPFYFLGKLLLRCSVFYKTNVFGIFSIKRDLARSCFQLWLKIGDEGDKISRKKTGEALAETVFFSHFMISKVARAPNSMEV